MKKIFIAVSMLFLTSLIFSQQINQSGKNILERFLPPKNYERVEISENSFGSFLRKFPLKAYGSPVLMYNGQTKRNNVHISVFNMPLLNVDLIQCADAVIKLRAEYLYNQKRYSEIQFHITNGMLVHFEKFANGERVIVFGNKTQWKSGHKKGFDIYYMI